MRFRVEREGVAELELGVLRDDKLEAEVRIAPLLGNTCVGYRVGDWRVLDEPPDAAELREHASRYGIPVLFPWPNRVRQAHFSFGGREYYLPPTSGMPHANHGLVRALPWRPGRQEADAGAATVQSEIRSADHPELAAVYPSAFRLVVSHSLRPGRLEVAARVENVGPEPLPFGYGLHPYFTVPLGPAGLRGSCEIQVSADQAWELEQNMPTGNRVPVRGQLDLRRPRALGDATYDDVLTALRRPAIALLRDPVNRRQVRVWADVGFRELVVFAPANRSIVALEPHTCTTDALNFEAQGLEAGLRVLQPGGSWEGRVEIWAGAIDEGV